MNSTECRAIAGRIGLMCKREWPAEKLEEYAKALAHSVIGGLPHDVVDATLTMLFAEVDADAITLPKLVEAVKTRPVVQPRKYLPEPENADTPVTRGLRTAERNEVPPPKARPEARAAMRDMLVRLGARMRLRCGACQAEFREADLWAYTEACMQAGRSGGDAPLRRCVDCSEPVRVVEQWDELEAPPF